MSDAEILEFLRNKFGVAKRGNGNWVRFRCPTCTPNDSYKLKRGLHLKSLASNCFICRQPLSVSQIFGTNKIVVSNVTPYVEPKEHKQARVWPCDGYIPISALPKGHPAVKFLEKDHIHDLTRIYLDYKVGYILPEDAHSITFDRPDGTAYNMSVADSLIFPVYFNKEFIGWQCRFISGTRYGDKVGKMKYLHVFFKGRCLYNYDNAKEYESVVVVEGVKKAWKFDNAVATFGKCISDAQLQLLLTTWKEIIFFYDGEDDTQVKVKELVNIISKNRKCINIDPRDYGYNSPDDMDENTAKLIVYQEWIKHYNIENYDSTKRIISVKG